MRLKTLHLKLLLLYLCLCLLSACASLNSKFDCPMKPGVRCQSIDTINTMVDNGQLGAKAKPCFSCAAAKVPFFGKLIAPRPILVNNPITLPPPNTVRIWLASYEDKDGDYHQPAVIYSNCIHKHPIED